MPGNSVVKGKAITSTYRKRIASVDNETDAAMRVILAGLENTAKDLSNARAYRMSDPKQRRLTPYARRRPNPSISSFRINRQTGEYWKSWRTRKSRSGRTVKGRLYNISRVSSFLTAQGTKHMIGRDIWGEIIRTERSEIQKQLQLAMKRIMNKR